MELPGFETFESFSIDHQFLIYRSLDQRSGKHVLLKILRQKNPSRKDIQKIHHDFRISSFAKGPRIQNSLELIRHEDLPILVIEDNGSVPLSRMYPNGVNSVEKFFEIAMSISLALKEIHEKRILHQALRPGNIWVQPETGIARITDFSSSTFSGKDTSPSVTPDLSVEILSYLPPELTGRLSRVLDLRTDFYSLGIIFYQMITGMLPFVSKDRNELLHAHLARRPALVHTLRDDLPVSISLIIAKLLEKDPEQRYASINGLIYDLELSRKEYEDKNQEAVFVPGTRDVPDLSFDPSALYGRDREKAVLESSLDRVFRGETGLVLITGDSGSGKSALAKSFLKSISERGGIVVQGKFDQYETSVPFGGLIHSLRDLVSIFLSKPEKDIKEFKKLILQYTGANGKILLNQIPELEFIIGPQPELAELPPDENRNRFYFTLRNFIRAISEISRPLVLYMDDLQWADPASLKLIETFLIYSKIKNFLCILSYRPEATDKNNTFSKILESLESNRVQKNLITVNPLDEESIYRLLQDLAPGPEEEIRVVSSILHKKTLGNPFAIVQLLRTSEKTNSISYQFETKLWKWDNEKALQLPVADNVIDLLCQRIRDLSPGVQELLGVCSCLGERFTSGFISKLHFFDTAKLNQILWEAVREGLLAPSHNQDHSLFEENVSAEQAFGFSHDRVQQAAYSLLEEWKRKEFHKKVGIALLDLHGPSPKNRVLFQITNHLNQSREVIEEDILRKKLTLLNYKAGLQAKSSGAYESSLQYLNSALNSLDQEAMINDLELYSNVILETAETEYLLNNYERTMQLLESLENLNLPDLQYIRADAIQVRLYSKMNKVENAVLAGLRAMRRFKINIPSSPLRVTLVLFKELFLSMILSKGKTDIELVNVRENGEPEYQALIDLFADLGPSAFTYNQNLFALIVLKMFNTSLTKGVSRSSPIAYSGYGMIVNQALKDLNQAIRYSKLAMDLNDKIHFDLVKWKVQYVYSAYLCHWKRHITLDIGLLDDVHNGALQNGDIFYAGFSMQAKTQKKIFASIPIEELLNDIENADQYFTASRDSFAFTIAKSSHQFIKALAGKTQSPDSLDDENFHSKEFEKGIIDDKNFTALSYFYHDLTKLYYFSGNFQKGLEAGQEGEKLIQNAFGLIPYAEFWFYYGLTILENFKDFSFSNRTKFSKKLKLVFSLFEKWSKDCPENFMGHLELLRAERDRNRGKVGETISGYERAIKLFQESGFLSFQALSCEIAAKFHYKNGNFSLGNHYIQHSIDLYSRWGAATKVDDLENRFSNRLDLSLSPEAIGRRIQNQTPDLDQEIILKTYNLLSGEIVLDNLLKKLIQIAMETAGATRAIYFHLHNKNLMVYLAGQSGEDGIVVENLPELEETQYPVSYLNYVFRTGKMISTNGFDSSSIKDFTDQYIKEKRPQSVICIPLVHAGGLKGVLYLENQLVKGIFTENRIQTLELIAGQAAISIENANLYAELEEKVIERTSELNNTINLIQKDLLYAQKIQDRILPKPEATLGGIYILTKYIPMNEVGGDIYDYAEISPGKIRIFLADATGHGVQAALVTMLIKSEYESLKYLDLPPGEVISELNKEIIAKYSAIKSFFSCLIADVDTSEGTLSYSAAGHPDQFCLTGSTVTRLSKSGPIIGISDKVKYQSQFLEIAKGDKMFFFSDGIVEEFNAFEEEFGEERLLDSILKESSKSVPDLVKSIFGDLEAFLSGQKTQDDITFLSVEVL
ncbi:trifunctional serine/threonine-protein kinase/ATP-binding protein/SpoIIE family protein phosphatase [Leptospira adleri]|uniref:trifunctional serine/threonine-protein kinase/ATP-binding protein/SpoIIE family protein phosphatase n=1 Tax=Leptospira adleri TaxID=2023186 RepID=UPI001082BF68|nr:trifunctional serine/threonine-protein kinase/ATP-binding protein/SpoIIE family protein phosphatase [Leptospira adleri]TGM60124.1 GAF domain-containing protein [Leptospira adleri]